ncbi:hypothetical protein ACFYNO_03745 [Kitasatospora sp. NPDC006697]|uniref:hypothetical protein n=1 Tax=Kitasatospora sp. NPDC006697 TaxID=3364020 RepID=UPI0036D0270F
MAVEERTATVPGEDPSWGTDPGTAQGSASPRVPRPAGRPARLRGAAHWTTPRRVRALTALALAALLAFAGVTASVLTGARDAADEIGHRAAPQAVRAADLYFALSDMDAQAANLLLLGSDGRYAAQRPAVLAAYEQRRKQADADLEQAAESVGGAAGARRAAQDELDGLGRYEALVAQLEDQENAAHAAPGQPPADALASYRQATDLLRATLLPGADTVAANNAATVDHRYGDERSALSAGYWEVLAAGLLALALLAALQRTLAVRYRRLLSPPLLLGGALTAAALVWGLGAAAAADGQLHTAKANAYDSVIALGRARAVAYDSNADESRWLVDPTRAEQYQQAFLTKSQQIAGFDAVTAYPRYLPALNQATAEHRGSAATVPFHGFLGDELRNITFPGEQQAADRVLEDYRTYQSDDTTIRTLQGQGRLGEAIAFDTGTGRGQSDGDFNQLSEDFDQVIAINQSAFDRAVADSDADLGAGAAAGLGALAAAALALTVLAVRPRLREYR